VIGVMLVALTPTPAAEGGSKVLLTGGRVLLHRLRTSVESHGREVFQSSLQGIFPANLSVKISMSEVHRGTVDACGY
jgi:hypothetical protein